MNSICMAAPRVIPFLHLTKYRGGLITKHSSFFINYGYVVSNDSPYTPR
jgi:hypothetical protein